MCQCSLQQGCSPCYMWWINAILFTRGKHLHDRINSLRGEVLGPKNLFNTHSFKCLYQTRKVYVSVVSLFLCFFLLDCGTALTYGIFCFIILLQNWLPVNTFHHINTSLFFQQLHLLLSISVSGQTFFVNCTNVLQSLLSEFCIIRWIHDKVLAMPFCNLEFLFLTWKSYQV